MKGSKILLGLIVYGFTICVVLAAAGFWWLSGEFTKPGPVQEPTLFVVERGMGASNISYALHQQQLIENPYIFRIGVTVVGDHTKLKAGEYEIQPGMSARDIGHMMAEGKVVERRVTIREGLTSYEIVQLLNDVENLKGEITTPPEEGTLLPQTYDYRLDEDRAEIITRLEDAMTKTIDELWEGRAANLPFDTKEEALTLASIVEKETGVAEERKRVAGVFVNRLRQGIALQTDPTVIYAITKGKHKNDGKGPLGRRLLRKDLEFDSPYNTYKYPGLPPGPIANPGRASIEAVLNPEKHDYIYFVADGTGGHMFAKTLAEHNDNVAKWRKIRREKK